MTCANLCQGSAITSPCSVTCGDLPWPSHLEARQGSHSQPASYPAS